MWAGLWGGSIFGGAVIPAQVRALVGDEEKSLYLGVLLASGGGMVAIMCRLYVSDSRSLVLAFSMSPLVGTFRYFEKI